jgi:hypothetical protein
MEIYIFDGFPKEKEQVLFFSSHFILKMPIYNRYPFTIDTLDWEAKK